MDAMRGTTSTHSGAARAGRILLAAALLALALPASARDAARKATPARPAADSYPLRAQVRVRASPVLDRDMDGEAVATISAARAGMLRVRLESGGYACELEARRSGEGDLAFAPGQRCASDVSEPTARGRAEATLRSGSGRLSGDRLALELAFDLEGTMSLHVAGRTMEVLGQTVELPAGWTPAVPLRGTATASAEGRRSGVARAE
jgi:hypothetical protein